MYSLDTKDKKILRLLEKNARESASVIGRTVGLKPDVVQYRLNRLEEHKIIQGYLGYINFHKIGVMDYGIYLNTSFLDKTKEEQALSFLKNHPSTTFIAKTGGEYNLLVGILAKDPIELNKLIKELITPLSQEQEIVIRLSLQIFHRDYLTDSKINKILPSFGGPLEEINLDELDKKIVQIISKNAREKIIDIAAKAKAPASTIIARLKKLEQQKVITGYYPLINPTAYGYQAYNLLIKGAIDEKKLESYCQQQGSIIWLIKTLGSWNYELGIEVQDQKKLQQLVDSLKTTFPSITKTSILVVFDILKFDQYPFR